MTDLELLHYFSTMTYATLSSRSMLREFWRSTAPRIGMEYAYVMRSILAVAALHLSINRPHRADFYRAVALSRHGRATQDVAVVLPSPSRDNADSLFLFTMLTLLVALNSTRGDEAQIGRETSDEAEFPNWVFLMGGTRALIPLIQENLSSSMLAPVLAFHRGRSETASELVGQVRTQHPALAELSTLVQQSLGLSSEDISVYAMAIEELNKALQLSSSLGESGQSMSEVTEAFMRLFAVSDDFLPLLKRREQEAVAIFAFWCVLLKRVGDVWWISGWARTLISRCHGMLDQIHRLWIRWPMEEIGWSPP